MAGEAFIILLRVTLLTVAIYSILKYKSLSSELGYCDSSSLSNRILDQRVKEYDELANSPDEADAFYSFLPIPMECTPCPQYAICQDGHLRECEAEFLLTDSLLSHIPFSSFFDGIPYFGSAAFPPRCEPDSEKRALAADVGVHVLSTLEKHKGNVICGGIKRRKGLSDQVAFGLKESDVHAFISALKDKSISQTEFDEIWALALKDLVDNEELDRLVQENGDSLIIARNAQIGFSCKIRMKLGSIIKKWRLEFFTLIALFFGYTMALSKIRRSSADKKRVKQLVHLTIEQVRERAYRHMEDTSISPFVIPEQVRDEELADVHSSTERQRLWSRVRKIVESNANIQVKQLELEGEITDVFEWRSS
ncbi:hypothetical protein E3Q22_01178 [Wallemia mellicola]|uniref:Man1/Src1-like C-terminal domain-containing protein n=1 Tax=Wallemia mellicola TaxID=1708541 RepID=A0A4T0MDV2_9BASI|nr:hypothetical protein E3Q22_01178 [Wallemia mellicola]